MVNGLLLAAAWAAAARTPMCMLSLESTEEDILVGCRLARLIPNRSCCLSSLNHHKSKCKIDIYTPNYDKLFHGTYLTKMTESPANSLLPPTKRLQPVVSKCRLG
jgi:hypothetical protein